MMKEEFYAYCCDEVKIHFENIPENTSFDSVEILCHTEIESIIFLFGFSLDDVSDVVRDEEEKTITYYFTNGSTEIVHSCDFRGYILPLDTTYIYQDNDNKVQESEIIRVVCDDVKGVVKYYLNEISDNGIVLLHEETVDVTEVLSNNLANSMKTSGDSLC